MADNWFDRQEQMTVPVDEHTLEIAYYEAGSGHPVLFVHGIPTSSFLWRRIAPLLADEYRVIAPDMAGYGESTMRDGFDRSIRAQEEMIAGLIGELDLETVSIVGHDLGGGVGLRYAVHHPEDVEQLVLSNAVCYDSWPIEEITELGLPATAAELSVDELQELLEETFRETLATDDPDEAFLETMIGQWASADGLVSLSRNAIATNTNHTTEIDPGDVTARTLLLWGAEDTFQPISYAERLENDITDATLVGLEDATHWVMEDRPDAYREELTAFLETP